MNPKGRILIVDDDLSVRQFLTIMLERAGYGVKAAASARDALRFVERHEFDLVITDLKMPDIDGMELLQRVKQAAPTTEVIMITAYGTTDTAVEAMKKGAYDYIIKPFKIDELQLIIEKAIKQQALAAENQQLREELRERDHYQNIIGGSVAMQQVFMLIEKVKDNRINVLITGESGTGKELVARAIHYSGVRANRPFVGINCSAIPESLIESELFGHKKGAFTGAVANKKGLFEAASSGTLFLDEIGELPPSTQVKLLRAIQERKIKAVGGLDEVEVDARIIAATNRDLDEEVAQGRFREDLFWRLNVIPLVMPPLRDRREDIPSLLDHFISKYAIEYEVSQPRVSEDTLNILLDHDYPGNVRELENLVERCVALAGGAIITPMLLPPNLQEAALGASGLGRHSGITFPEENTSLDEVLADVETRLLTEALRRTQGRKKDAAVLLGISFRSLRYRLSKLQISTMDENSQQ